MARFRATIKGQRGEASRLGSAKSGITANVNGWNAEVEIEARDSVADVFDVYMTFGSNKAGHRTLLGRVVQAKDGAPVWHPYVTGS